jgi:hypothetical protein
MVLHGVVKHLYDIKKTLKSGKTCTFSCEQYISLDVYGLEAAANLNVKLYILSETLRHILSKQS